MSEHTCRTCDAPTFKRPHTTGPWPQYCSTVCRKIGARRYAVDYRVRIRHTVDTDPEYRRRERRRKTLEARKRRDSQSGFDETCSICGASLKRLSLYCSRPCYNEGQRRIYASSEHQRARRQRNDMKRKARLLGVRSEPYDRSEVFERDEWSCQLCGTLIDRHAQWPAPLSPSIDHIQALAAGGHDVSDNVQAAHLRCNQSKGKAA